MIRINVTIVAKQGAEISMMRVNSIRLGYNKAEYPQNRTENNVSQCVKVQNRFATKNGALKSDIVNFSGNPYQSGIKKLFYLSDSFISAQKLTLELKKLLRDGTIVDSLYDNGLKLYEERKGTSNFASWFKYDKKGKMTSITNEYYGEKHQLVKDEFINLKARNQPKETSFYDIKGRERERTVKIGDYTEYHKYDEEHNILSFETKEIDKEDGSIFTAIYDVSKKPYLPQKTITEYQDGSFFKTYMTNEKVTKSIAYKKLPNNEDVTTEILYNNDEKIIFENEIYSNGSEFTVERSPDGEKIIKTIGITIRDDSKVAREEITYVDTKPDSGIVFLDGEVTFFTKYVDGFLAETRDTDGYIVPLRYTNELNVDKLFKPKNDNNWEVASSLNEIIGNTATFNKINSN